jgi:hypothetical protein
MVRPLLTLALALAMVAPARGAAAAARRISIGPVAGSRGAAIPTQLAEALCGSFDCVLWREVSTGGKPDPAKLRRAGVAGALTGAVSGTRVRLVLAGPAGALERWTFDLGPGRKLRAASVDQVVADVGRRLARPAPPPAAAAGAAGAAGAAAVPPSAPAAPAPSPAQPPAKVARPEPAPEGAAPGRAAAPPAAAAPAAPAAAAAAPPRAAPRPPAGPPPLRIAVELGGFWTSRSLTYDGVGAGTGTLYEFDASSILGPRGRIELYPAAGFTQGAGAGIGLFVDAALSIGLETEGPGGEKRDSTYSRLAGGALWRLPVGKALALVPSVAYESLKLRVDPPIQGLPEADLAGVAGRLGAEIRIARPVKLLLGAGYVWWLTARDLVDGDPAYFPDGSAAALEGEAGLDVAVAGRVSLRVVGQYSSTAYDLDPDPTGTYVATGATDRFVSVNASVRAEF